MRIYTAEDIEIISLVQTVALNTALPTVLSILKNSHDSGPLTLIEINERVHEDIDLKRANYEVSNNKIIECTIEGMISKNLLKRDGEKVEITKKGRDAVKLLLGPPDAPTENNI